MNREERLELLGLPRAVAKERIAEERRCRNFGLGELKSEFGADWLAASTKISHENDQAIDALLMREDMMEEQRSHMRRIIDFTRDLARELDPKTQADALACAAQIEREAELGLAGEPVEPRSG